MAGKYLDLISNYKVTTRAREDEKYLDIAKQYEIYCEEMVKQNKMIKTVIKDNDNSNTIRTQYRPV